MKVLTCRNVNWALPRGLELLKQIGVRETSRNGEVIRSPEPVTTVYTHPAERVLFDARRDANPFFHLVEAVWMLAGRNDLKALTPYVKRMADYSDDGGKTQPGAYGRRWRRHFLNPERRPEKLDQLRWAIRRLAANPGDRRAVISMWDPEVDVWAADHDGADVPCNLSALPWVEDDKLHLTVFCRSNDIVWGAYGANAVHFSYLQEFIAWQLNLGIGTLTQISNNYHAYRDTLPVPLPERVTAVEDPYMDGRVVPYALGLAIPLETVDQDLLILFEHGPGETVTKARWPFLRQVVVPMMIAHHHWKVRKGPDRYTTAYEVLDQVKAADWRLAAFQWLERRARHAQKTAEDAA